MSTEDTITQAELAEAPEGVDSEPEGYWARIAFVGHNEYTGYVTEIVKHGQPAYHVDLPEKLWGGNPLSCIEYAATAWFSERPLTEASVRAAWDAEMRRAEARRQQAAEWEQMQQRALTAGGEAIDDDEDYDGEGPF